MFRGFLVFLLLQFFSLSSELTPKELEKMAPYLMEENHPAKALLDTIFTSSRAILNLEALEKAGFDKSSPRKFTKLIVTRHPALPGYIFKLYLDAQRFHKDVPEYVLWARRVKGAEKIQSYIAAQELEDQFKVPKKWIYLLPEFPKPPNDYYPKSSILVEEDMLLLSDKANKALWASSHVQEGFLKKLYKIIKKIGLQDAAKPDNIPFSLDGRIAFVDTETSGSKDVAFENLLPHLSKPNKRIWRELISR